jgi:hypothetical protein
VAAEYVWDVEAVDTAGQPLVTWRGLRLADAGPLPRNAAWPPSLLSVYLERSAVALGLHPDLRVTVHAGQPDGLAATQASVPQPSPAPDTQRSLSTLPPRDRRSSPARGHSAPGTGRLDGFTLSVRAPGHAFCGWEAADPGPDMTHPLRDAAGPEPDADQELSPDLAGVEAELRRRGERPSLARARLRAVSACLAGLGELASAPVIAGSAVEADWLVLSVPSARATLASAIVEISGVSCPVAVAIMTSDRGRHASGTADGSQTADPDRTEVLERMTDPDQTADLGRPADLAGARGGTT